jgi:protein tyrosine phosphatase
MLTGLVENGRTKCERYWPTQTKWSQIKAPTTADSSRDPTTLVFGRFTVRLTHEEVHPNYIVSELKLSRANWSDERRVTHLWYQTWGDGDTVENMEDVVEFVEEFRRRKNRTKSLPLVHCNAGIGRTGVFLAADVTFDQYIEERKCDILQAVSLMRQDRGASVQNVVCYL